MIEKSRKVVPQMKTTNRQSSHFFTMNRWVPLCFGLRRVLKIPSSYLPTYFNKQLWYRRSHEPLPG